MSDSLILQKLHDMATYYGLDDVSDKLLIRIARHKKPWVKSRLGAIATIFSHKLPIPVPKRKSSHEDV